jgi:hypothetical protein
MSTPKILYILSCRHVMPGAIGAQQLVCYNCDMPKLVVDVHTWEWRMVCSNCNYSPWCGLSQMTANHHADVHARKRQHKTGVRYLENPYGVKVQQRMQEGTDNAGTASSNGNK